MGASVFLAAFLIAGQTTPLQTFDDKVQKLSDDVKQNLLMFDSLKTRVTNEKEAQKLVANLSEKMNSIAVTAVKYQAQAKTDDQRVKLSIVRFEALAGTGESPDQIATQANEIATKYKENLALCPYIENLLFIQYLADEKYAPFDVILKQSKNEEVLASSYLANFFMQSATDSVDINKFNILSVTYPKTKAGQRAARVYNFRTKMSLGAPMPDLEFDLMNGTKFRVQSMKGRVVVIDFWGFWCTACTGEMPEIKDYVKNNPTKLAWIGVNTDSWTKGFLTQRMKGSGLNWQNVYAGSTTGQLPMDLGIINYPSKIIIDSFGVIQYVPSIQDWRRVLEDALSKA
jgi:thiol-disulfide isomerase/thioredoxin